MSTHTDHRRDDTAPVEELEDDVAEMVCHLANAVSQDSILQNWEAGPSDVMKQQFRDALNKAIDERIKLFLATPPKEMQL